MTAGTIGCGSYGREIELNNPILDVTAGDYIIKDVSYFDIDIDGNSARVESGLVLQLKMDDYLR